MLLADIFQHIRKEKPLCIDNDLAQIIECITYINPHPQNNEKTEIIHEFPLSFKNEPSPLLTFCVLTKNEERCIQRCIQSIYNHADEIIVIDTGSTDNTLEVIRSEFEGIRIYNKEWTNDFSDIRNYALNLATYTWVFFLDADEYMKPESLDTLKDTLKLAEMIEDQCYCLSPSILDLNGNRYTNTQRILNKKFDFYYTGRVHEEPKSHRFNKVFDIGLSLTIFHDGYEQNIYLNKRKAERNMNMIKLMLNEEPNNLKWNYYHARALLRYQQAPEEYEAEQELLRVSVTVNKYTSRSLILLGQLYCKRADIMNLKKIIALIKESNTFVPQVDLMYLEMALNLMLVLTRMNTIRNEAEKLIGGINNSLIHSRNEHLKNIAGLYSFHMADFNKITDFLTSNENSLNEIPVIHEEIASSLNLLDRMKHKLSQIY